MFREDIGAAEAPTRTCHHCNKTLPMTADYFNRNKHHPSGFHLLCKSCRGAYRTALRNRDPVAAREKEREYEDRTRDERNSRIRANYHSQRSKKQKSNEDSREWYKKNKEYKLAYNRKWRSENPEKVKRQILEAYHRDPLRYKISNAIRGALAKRGLTKEGQSIVDVLPYSVDELRVHLERQFTKKMTWENHGTYWEIDHILPLCGFNVTSINCEEFQSAWAITNLRPLEARKNRSKGGKRTLLL